MPAKIQMVLSNGNFMSQKPRASVNIANLGFIPTTAPVSAPTPLTRALPTAPLNSSIIGRVHNAKSGCGCGRK